MTDRSVETRRRRGPGLLGLGMVILLMGCAANKPRKTCGLARTNDRLKQWFAKYERNPALLRSTVEPMLSSATAVVKSRLTTGGIDMRPNPANARAAIQRAHRYTAERDWKRALRWSYVALAVLPRTPAHGRLRLAMVLQLARSLYALKAYQASALYALYYRQHPMAMKAGKGLASGLLDKLYDKLLKARYLR